MTNQNTRYQSSFFIQWSPSIDCLSKDEVKSAETFREENRDLINEIDMYKHHLDPLIFRLTKYI